MTEKSDIRKEVRRRISSLSPRQRLDAASSVFDRIERSEAFARATCVALYASLPDEVPTHETIQRWASVKRVVLPRVEGDTMRFFDYDPATMRRGSFGIDEPEAEGECTPDAIDLIIIPARAFTPRRQIGARQGLLRPLYVAAGVCGLQGGCGFRMPDIRLSSL